MAKTNYDISIQTIKAGVFFNTENLSGDRLFLKSKLISDQSVPYAITVQEEHTGALETALPVMNSPAEAYDASKELLRKIDRFTQNELVTAFVETKFCQTYYSELSSNYLSSITSNCEKLQAALTNKIGKEQVEAIETSLNNSYKTVFIK